MYAMFKRKQLTRLHSSTFLCILQPVKAANRQLSDAYSSEAVVDVKISSPASAKSSLEELSDRARRSEQHCLLTGGLQL